MELQWELILFTTFTAWSAGLFGAQALAAAFGKAKKAQMISWIVAAVLLVVGGISVFFHLQHWERIFNGFGQMNSGITQELIAIVILAIVAVIYLVFMRRSEDGASVPKWLAWVAVVICVVLVYVMGHSYMMNARPAWDTYLWVAYIFGNAAVLGPATLAFLMALKSDEDLKSIGTWVLIGTVVNLVLAAVYAAFVQFGAAEAFTEVGFYFDPTMPTKEMTEISPIVGDQTLLMWVGAVGIGALLPAILAFVAKSKSDAASWKVWSILIVILAIIGAIMMRVVFYNLGLSVFMFY